MTNIDNSSEYQIVIQNSVLMTSTTAYLCNLYLYPDVLVTWKSVGSSTNQWLSGSM